MARNNHQEAIERTSETARAGVREATDHAENVMQTGIQAAQRVADEFGRVFGFGGQNEDLTRQATQNLEAITETGTSSDAGLPGRFKGVARTNAGAAAEERARDDEARAMPHVAGPRRCSERLGAGQPEPNHRCHPSHGGAVDEGC
jgi:hypothetical protein